MKKFTAFRNATTRFYQYLLRLLIFLVSSYAQSQNIILPNAFAHNDYFNKRPLLDALENGFIYVEADIYLRNDELIVAHVFPALNKGKTLEKLYLQPLVRYLTENENKLYTLENYPITLMIDIKSNVNKTYQVLEPLLEKYKWMFSYTQDGKFVSNYVTIVISGNKPTEIIKAKKERYVFLDEDLRHTGDDRTANMYPISSCRFSSILTWNGSGPMPPLEKQKLEAYVKKAHDSGRKVRLYGSPDHENAWKELLSCNVDLINTDKIRDFRQFFITNAVAFTATR